MPLVVCRPELGNTPYYDYKMVDTDLLLLPTVARYFLDIPQGANRYPCFLISVHTEL